MPIEDQIDGNTIGEFSMNEVVREKVIENVIEKKRYTGLDCFRGMVLISMVLFHTTWDLVYLFGVEWEWFLTEAARIWQQSICWSFILLSGFCWRFGKQPWKRGLLVFCAGALITIVTKLFMPTEIVFFGVLTLLGSCMILLIPLNKMLKNWNPVLSLILFFVLFVVTRNVNYGYLGFEQWNWLALPKEWYANWFTTYLGFMHPGFFSTDYFSLIPWLFLFITGYFLELLFEKYQWLDVLCVSKNSWLEWLGRHSLVIYMLHQPMVYGVLWLLHLCALI